MKHLLLLSLFTAFLWACHKDQDPAPPKTQVELLPPATQEGKRTFGCLIDGKAWTPKAGIVPPPVSVFYNEITGQFNITARRIIDSYSLQGFAFNCTIPQPGVLLLPIDKAVFTDTSSVCPAYDVNPLNGIGLVKFKNTNGYLDITKLDISTGIISGIFEFDAYSDSCQDTFRITQGRFDLRYKYQ
jgi:hypothetical protein